MKIAELNLRCSEPRTTCNGQVTNLCLAQSNYATTDQVVVALVDQRSSYVVVYFGKTKLSGIRADTRVQICLMSGDQSINGMVEGINSSITDRNPTPDGQLLIDVESTFNWMRLM